MRTSECDILFVPGLGGAGPDHWQTRWEGKLSTARRVEQDDWDAPNCRIWARRIADSVAARDRPVVLVAHSLGVAALVHAAPLFAADSVKGAFLVAVSDIERDDLASRLDPAFTPLPRNPLPFPSLLIASRNDPSCGYERAEDFSYAWGAALVDAGDAGHLDPASGYGPWPEGLMRFAGFLKRL